MQRLTVEVSLHIRRSRRGVSLVEVMVVIAILTVLMTVLAVGVHSAWKRSQVKTSTLVLGRVAQDVQIYELSERRVPTAVEGLGVVYVDEPVPADAWGSAIVYEAPEPRWDLLSLGADRTEGGEGWASDLRWSEQRP